MTTSSWMHLPWGLSVSSSCSAHLDITLYVVRRGFTRRNALRSINELYQDGKLKHVNLLFNDVKAGQGYGEGYGYYTK